MDINKISEKIAGKLRILANNSMFWSFLYKLLEFAYQNLTYILKKDFRKIKKLWITNFSNIYVKFKVMKNKDKIISRLSDKFLDKHVIILPPSIDWHKPLFQRPQQLAKAYSQLENVSVIYLTKNIEEDNVLFYELISEDCWLMNDLLSESINDIICSAKSVTISISWTYNKVYLDMIKYDKLIYEYIDELDIFALYGHEMEQDHRELLKKSDLVVCTATKLLENVKAIDSNSRAILSTNAGDYDFFSKTDQYEINSLIEEKIKKYDNVLGYYGALAEWFDYNLIKEVAMLQKNWVWILVGLDYDGTLHKSGILDLENVVYISAQPYEKLPTFLKAFDIATIPFLINEITLSTSPVKIFEYMAGNKPILSSPMPECLKYESVNIYNNSQEFIEQVTKIINLEQNDIYWEILKKDAKDNTWLSKAKEILNNLVD